MRRLTIALFAFVGIAALSAQAEEWHKTYSLNGMPDLKVTASDARLEFQSWDRNEIEVRVMTENVAINSNALRIIENQSGNRVEVNLRDERHFRISFHYHEKVEVIVHLPRKATLRARTSDGSIRLSGVEGNMEVESSDGRIEVDSVSGNLNARTSDGRIIVSGRFDQLDLKTSDGSIEATALAGSHVTGSWNVHTSDGHVTLKLPASLAADFDVHTNDGHIDLGLPMTVSGRQERQTVRGKLNGGGGMVTVRTSDGSIRLEKI